MPVSVKKAVLWKAIAAKCKDCIYDPLEPGTSRDQIEACTSCDCPLYQVRPRKIASSAKFDAPASKEQCDTTPDATTGAD